MPCQLYKYNKFILFWLILGQKTSGDSISLIISKDLPYSPRKYNIILSNTCSFTTKAFPRHWAHYNKNHSIRVRHFLHNNRLTLYSRYRTKRLTFSLILIEDSLLSYTVAGLSLGFMLGQYKKFLNIYWRLSVISSKIT